MYMVIQFLIPGMEYLDDTGCCPEILPVSRQLEKCFGAASVKETIEKPLIAVDQRVQFMWECKYDMKVRRINDFRAAFIHPDLFQDSLTVWAVAVFTGIIVKLCVTTVRALADVTAEFSRFTVQDGKGGFPLHIRLKVSR
jgi:hypothetical protein